MSAAAEARRADPDLEIVTYDRGGYASYRQCGLPYLVGGIVDDHQRLVAGTVEQFAALRPAAAGHRRRAWPASSTLLRRRGRSGDGAGGR